MSDNKLNEVVNALEGATTSDGLAITVEIIDAPGHVLKVTVETREEFPIILDVNDDQILAIVNLWDASEVKEGAEAEMMSTMLSMNIALPLSAFGKTGSQYQLFGALSADSKLEVIVQEVDVLSSNLEAVLEAFVEYLN